MSSRNTDAIIAFGLKEVATRRSSVVHHSDTEEFKEDINRMARNANSETNETMRSFKSSIDSLVMEK